MPAAVSRRSHDTTSVTAPSPRPSAPRAGRRRAKTWPPASGRRRRPRPGDAARQRPVRRRRGARDGGVLLDPHADQIRLVANEKLTAKGLDHVNSLRDIAGVRVVVDEGPQPIGEEAGYALCYRVLRRLATSPYVREVTDLKDYVRAPKPNGYRSLHATIVPTSSRLPRFEIQVRTRAMDDVALHGSAAHRAYKLAAASPRVAGVV